jgi:hypothetical protein
MAQLEFQFIRALDHSEHGIPNLQRQLVKLPALFIQVLALTFRRSDDGEDPPEWRFDDVEHKEAVCSAAYTLLNKIQRIPGTDDSDDNQDRRPQGLDNRSAFALSRIWPRRDRRPKDRADPGSGADGR